MLPVCGEGANGGEVRMGKGGGEQEKERGRERKPSV